MITKSCHGKHELNLMVYITVRNLAILLEEMLHANTLIHADEHTPVLLSHVNHFQRLFTCLQAN